MHPVTKLLLNSFTRIANEVSNFHSWQEETQMRCDEIFDHLKEACFFDEENSDIDEVFPELGNRNLKAVIDEFNVVKSKGEILFNDGIDSSIEGQERYNYRFTSDNGIEVLLGLFRKGTFDQEYGFDYTESEVVINLSKGSFNKTFTPENGAINDFDGGLNMILASMDCWSLCPVKRVELLTTELNGDIYSTGAKHSESVVSALLQHGFPNDIPTEYQQGLIDSLKVNHINPDNTLNLGKTLEFAILPATGDYNPIKWLDNVCSELGAKFDKDAYIKEVIALWGEQKKHADGLMSLIGEDALMSVVSWPTGYETPLVNSIKLRQKAIMIVKSGAEITLSTPSL
jgi:hypothetical protein